MCCRVPAFSLRFVELLIDNDPSALDRLPPDSYCPDRKTVLMFSSQVLQSA